MIAATQVSQKELAITPSAELSATRKLWTLLVSLLFIVVSVEGMSRAIHARRSITLENERSLREAIAIRRTVSQRQILFAGNSLVFDDLSQPTLKQNLGTHFHVHTAGIAGSTFYDWQYGLQALFGRGSQPDTVVFAISPSQFLRPPAVTPLLVSHLWRNQEILAYRREYGVNLTDSSELFLDRYSTFFSFRDTMRIYIRKSLPHFEELANLWASQAVASAVPGDAESALAERLARLQRECPRSTQLILLIAPTNQPEDAALEPSLRRAAQSLHISVIEPVREYEWPAAKFKPDAYHLNHDAANDFSALVGIEIRHTLDDPASRSANR